MKKIFKLLTPVIISTLLFISCDEDKTTVDTVFSDISRGAVFREIRGSVDRGNFSMFNQDAVFSLSAEVDDNNNGALLQDVEVYFSLIDRLNDGTDFSTEEALFTTIDASNFTEGPNGFPTTSFSTTLGEIADFLGLAITEWNAGDQFVIRFKLNLTDGRSFSSGNVAGTVSGGSFFRSPFRYPETIDDGIDLTFSNEGANEVALAEGSENDGYSATVGIDDGNEGGFLQTLNIYKRFSDNTVLPGGTSISVPEALLESFEISSLTLVDGVPTVDLAYTLEELLEDLVLEDLSPGDNFLLRFEVVAQDGRLISPSTFVKSIPVVPGCTEPLPTGTWTVVMGDSYDDGWQTTSANGGPGLTITLLDEDDVVVDVIQVGLCTPYEDNTYDCTPETSSGTATVEIPEGVTSAEWVLPGDWWGEISVTIVSPDGTEVGFRGPALERTAAIPIAIDLCK